MGNVGTIRYVDVIWLVTHVLQLTFMQQDLWCISKSMMKPQHKLNLL